MSATLFAIGNLCIVILLGWWIANKSGGRLAGEFGPQFWGALSKFVYFICVPCLLIAKLDTFRWDAEQGWFVLEAVVSIVAAQIFTIGLFHVLPFVREDKRTMQAITFQSNAVFLGFPLIESILGKEGLDLAIIFAGISWPIVNAASIAVLIFGQAETSQATGGWQRLLRDIWQKIRRDPIMLACVSGLILSLVRWDLPSNVREVLMMVGGLTIPLALMIVGARMKLTNAASTRIQLLSISIVKLILIPLVTWLVLLAFPITDLQRNVLVLLASTPVAVSSVLMVEFYGGRKTLGANAVTISTVLSLLTISAFAVLLI
ncbi:MAG: AEC family transporter [Candidatus Uhrbacteria bacterium]